MPLTGDVAVIIPAKNEADRIPATVAAAGKLAGVDLVVVVDDGSTDKTAVMAERAGGTVLRHARNRGKAAAMESGAEVVRLLEAGTGLPPRHLLFLDADLGDTAMDATPLIDPVRAGEADMTIAVFIDRVKRGGHGLVVGLSGAGIERATGWRPVQPLNGQRCLTRDAFEAARPLAAGWGAETGLTIDLYRRGLRIVEVEVPMAHRPTGSDWRGQLHRAHQLADVARALATREPAVRAVARHLPAGAGAGAAQRPAIRAVRPPQG